MCYHVANSSLLGACNLSFQDIYSLMLRGAINGGLALWIYYDIKERERSMLWVLGTFLIPHAFFPLYFWNRMPELTWICPKCQRDNRAWSRACGRCKQVYTADETAARLHGHLEPSDPIVILLITLLIIQDLARLVTIWIVDGPEALTTASETYALLGRMYLTVPHFWIVNMIVGNALIWLCIHCITVRYRRSTAAVGFRYNGNLSSLGIPLLLAPALTLIGIGILQGIGWLNQLISSKGLDALIQWEQQQWSIGMPESLGDSSTILIIFVVLILMPVGEEVLFRGIAYTAFADRFGRPKGILLSSCLFAILHGGIYQFTPLILTRIPLFLTGLVLVRLYIRTRSLIPCVLTHSLVNLILLVMWFGKG